MFIKEGRIFCMESFRNFMLVGTSKGYVIVFNAETKTRHNVVTFNDAVISVKVLPDKMHIVVGLACGDLFHTSTDQLLKGGEYLLDVIVFVIVKCFDMTTKIIPFFFRLFRRRFVSFAPYPRLHQQQFSQGTVCLFCNV